MGMWECSENIRPAHTLDLNSVSALHEHDENTERVDSSAKAVSKFHTHSIPLDMEDIERDWDKPVTEAGIAAKASVIVRVGAPAPVAKPAPVTVRQINGVNVAEVRQ